MGKMPWRPRFNGLFGFGVALPKMPNLCAGILAALSTIENAGEPMPRNALKMKKFEK